MERDKQEKMDERKSQEHEEQKEMKCRRNEIKGADKKDMEIIS